MVCLAVEEADGAKEYGDLLQSWRVLRAGFCLCGCTVGVFFLGVIICYVVLE